MAENIILNIIGYTLTSCLRCGNLPRVYKQSIKVFFFMILSFACHFNVKVLDFRIIMYIILINFMDDKTMMKLSTDSV